MENIITNNTYNSIIDIIKGINLEDIENLDEEYNNILNYIIDTYVQLYETIYNYNSTIMLIDSI